MTITLKQKRDEPRIAYLMRVLRAFMDQTPAGENTIIYDEAECDGLCLADDFAIELDLMGEDE